ncbi:MAG: hypothetical protein ACK4PR_11130 [Gammaproteobacteria bacterium]
MTRIFLFICALLISQTSLSQSSLFFNVAASGAPATVSITLCLDGLGPLSCQYYTVSALDLNITTTVPNHLYPDAGIKINTPGYTPTNCTPASNGYCLFSVSSTATANIPLNVSTNNPPWYPSLEAFEHYNSGRSHIFSQAQFGGSYAGGNIVNTT